MAAKSATIILGGESYLIHAFNIGEFEKLSDAYEGPTSKVPFTVLRMALARAEPKVADISTLEATQDEITQAVQTILELSGGKKISANPQDGPLPNAS